MCMFCAAIPIAASGGLVAQSKWRAKVEEAAKEGKPAPHRIPIMPITSVAIVGLMAGSVIFHTQISPRLGVW